MKALRFLLGLALFVACLYGFVACLAPDLPPVTP